MAEQPGKLRDAVVKAGSFGQRLLQEALERGV